MKIIFDLDGTLIDSKLRLYTLFLHLVPQATLTFEEYWNYKFAGKSNLNILEHEFGFKQNELDKFHKEWMRLIEHKDFLALDTPIPNVNSFLTSIQCKAELYLCTARQSHAGTIEQLKMLGLHDFFIKILVTQQTKTKSDLIRTEIEGLNSNDWIIGDMGRDVEVGRELAISSCAVLTGFMSEAKLKGYAPDLLLSSVIDFQRLVNSALQPMNIQ